MGEVNNIFKLINAYHFREGERVFLESRKSLTDGIFIRGSKFEISQKIKEKNFNKCLIFNLNADEDMSVHLLYSTFEFPVLFMDESIKIKVTKETGERILEKKLFIRDIAFLPGMYKMHFILNINDILYEVLKFVDENCKVAIFLESKKNEFDSSKMHSLILERFFDTFAVNFAKQEYSKIMNQASEKFKLNFNYLSTQSVLESLKKNPDLGTIVQGYKYILNAHRMTPTTKTLINWIENFEKTNDLFYLLQISSMIIPSYFHELKD